ncbi:MAG TPA: acetylglutamate kinase [Acidimicrobiales bacterium]|nr:acetylglutamate kinase [Acidimicrobiales bacterium]
MTNYVVKIGGHALDSLDPHSPVLSALASDVGALRDESTNVVIVHGGGPQIASLLDAVGVVSFFHEGLRVTNEETMEYVAMALSQVNLHVVAALNQAGLASAGLSGVDGSTLTATALGAPWFRAGTSPKVDATLIEALWARGVTPVVSSIAVDEMGDLLNCNADAAAGALAGALGAQTLVLLSDVDQLRSDPRDSSTALASVSAAEVRHLIDDGSAREGMRPKMMAAIEALEHGAQRVVLANGTKLHALRDALNGSTVTTEVTR